MAAIFMSTIPDVFKRLLISKQTVRRWAYLGSSEELLEKLRTILPADKEMNYSRELYDTSKHCRKDFINWIDDISLAGAVKKEWFFSVAATKNPYSSSLFLNVCYYLVAKQWAGRYQDLDVIVVDSPALGRLLKELFAQAQYPWLNHVACMQVSVARLFKTVVRFALFVIRSLRVRLAAQSVLGRRAKAMFQDRQARVLIRNYIDDDFNDCDRDFLERHFFPNLYSYLQRNEKHPMFLPIAINVKSYRRLFQKIKASRRDIVFAEEFLGWSDYLYALGAPWRAMFYKIAQCPLRTERLKPLVEEDFHFNITDLGFLNGILLSRLGRRFKAAGVVIETMINWSEFQSFEKGLIAGLREAYPDARLVGSQPLCAPQNHLSLTPSRQDRVFKVVPDKFLVLGPIAQTAAQEQLPDLDVGLTPAFRYQSIFDFPFTQGKDLIVLFGYGLANSLSVLKVLIELRSQMPAFRNILIKMHPATYFSKERLIQMVGLPVPENFKFIDGLLEQYLPDVMMGICGATGTAVELVVRGIPVAVVAEEKTLTMHYLPEDNHPGLWSLCFSREDIVSAVNSFYRYKTTQGEKLFESALGFRKSYFADPSERHWQNYVNSEAGQYDYAA